MKNRTRVLIGAAVILGALYLYNFTDWFAEKKIQIKYRILSGRGVAGDPITFYLDGGFGLTSVKVIATDEAATNKYPHAYWHLISDSNSVPTADFLYGEKLAGMKPKVTGIAPEPLRPGGKYRILVEAGKLKGEKDFQPHGKD